MNFDKWTKEFGTKDLVEEIKSVQNGQQEYKDVPYGQYEVKVEKIDIKECKSDTHLGEPMLFIQFRVLEGTYKGNCIFYNKLLTQAFSIHNANELLRDLDSGIDVDFDGNYSHYMDMLGLIKKNIDAFKLEYLLSYTTGKKGFKEYYIVDVYESNQLVDDSDLPY